MKRKKSGRADVGCAKLMEDGKLQGTQLSAAACASCRCQIWGRRCRAGTVSAVGRHAGTRGTKVPECPGGQVGGRPGANKGLFLGPSLSGKPSVAPREWRKGRACLELEVFHLLCKRQDQR